MPVILPCALVGDDEDDLTMPWAGSWASPHPCTVITVNDENGTKISRTDRFRFLYYGSVFKHKKLSVSIDFTTIFNLFLFFNC
jgi:hypothetical protein